MSGRSGADCTICVFHCYSKKMNCKYGVFCIHCHILHKSKRSQKKEAWFAARKKTQAAAEAA